MKENPIIDKATKIRSGEALDEVILKTYLREHLNVPAYELTVKQFPGGFSNLTYLLKIDEEEYVLRRPPFGAKIKSAHDMSREFKVLSLLKGHYSKIPSPILYCDDKGVIGAPFYLMSRAKGVVLRTPNALKINPGEKIWRQISETLIDNLVNLHNIDIKESGLIEMGKPEGYVERQVTGWTRRYEKAKTDEIPELEEITKWLNANMPTEYDASFIHNDYKYDNLILDASNLSEIIAVLDWEMATVGDPLMDLGTTLAYWAEPKDEELLKMFNPSWMPGNLSRLQLIDRYQEKRGKDAKNMLFYYLFGIFKICVIIQQIYARFKKGYTKDPRFASLIHVIKAMSKVGVKALEKDRIL